MCFRTVTGVRVSMSYVLPHQGSFPRPEHVAGKSVGKISSTLYYDRDGTVMAAGAEAHNASVASQAEDECWIKTEV